eukprot:11226-Prymnesium_polylepis.1
MSSLGIVLLPLDAWCCRRAVLTRPGRREDDDDAAQAATARTSDQRPQLVPWRPVICDARGRCSQQAQESVVPWFPVICDVRGFCVQNLRDWDSTDWRKSSARALQRALSALQRDSIRWLRRSWREQLKRVHRMISRVAHRLVGIGSWARRGGRREEARGSGGTRAAVRGIQ